jgi:hypothetical protein
MEESMSTTKNISRFRRFHWIGSAAVGALALTAIAVPLTPANAQIGVQVGPVGVGVGPYYGYYHPYHWGYYGPGPYGYYGPGPYHYGW